MWKSLAVSVVGTSHRSVNTPCQDRAIIRQHSDGICLVVSDGAGSARFAEDGAESVAKMVSESICPESPEDVSEIVRRVRQQILLVAEQRGVTTREFAATLSAAWVKEDHALFVQIGDGAILRGDGNEMDVVWWPEQTDQIGETAFVTDDHFEENLRFTIHPGRIEALAVISDGLHRLALDYRSGRGHGPFFAPLFRHLRETESMEELRIGLESFLDSERVNQRTDDDKTLVLACRMQEGP